jgi:hypothetical protein
LEARKFSIACEPKQTAPPPLGLSPKPVWSRCDSISSEAGSDQIQSVAT